MSIIEPELLPLIIPLAALDLALVIYSLYDIHRSEKKPRKIKIGWGLLVLLIGIIGPVLYLFAGRDNY